MSKKGKKSGLNKLLVVLLIIALLLLIPLLLAEYIKDYDEQKAIEEDITEMREENMKENDIHYKIYELRREVRAETAAIVEGHDIDALMAAVKGSSVSEAPQPVEVEEVVEPVEAVDEPMIKHDTNVASVMAAWEQEKAKLLRDFPLEMDQVYLIRLFADNMAYDAKVVRQFYNELLAFVSTNELETTTSDDVVMDMIFKSYYVYSASINGVEVGHSIRFAKAMTSYLDSYYSFDEPRDTEEMLTLKQTMQVIVEKEGA